MGDPVRGRGANLFSSILVLPFSLDQQEKFTVLWRVPVRFVAKRQRWPSRRRRRFQRGAPTRDSCTTEDLSTSSLDSARREDQTPTPPKERARLGQSKLFHRKQTSS